VIAKIYEDQYVWVGFVRAAAEAGMVGAIADWFAVTALFRHPLGLKIPHTAIIPRRKNSIGQQFGRFVQSNFLTGAILIEKLRTMGITHKAATWLSEPENSRLLVNQGAAAMRAVVQVINDDDVQDFIERSLEDRLRTTPISPLVGQVLSLISSGDREQKLLQGVINVLRVVIEENEDLIRTRISQEKPRWVFRLVDGAIYHKLVDAVSQTVNEVSENPHHPLHEQFSTLLKQFIADLQKSDSFHQRETQLKEELLESPLVRDFSSSLWEDIKAALLTQSQAPQETLRRPIERGLAQFGEAILNDPSLMEKIDRWVENLVIYAVEEYGHEVETLISQTISNWDAEATSQKIELHVGKDLQFIRINGTLVGGLVGLLIHSVVYILSLWGIG
jgi:uncharacterized membrane-anchored protein YjiN (DUF445 family)